MNIMIYKNIVKFYEFVDKIKIRDYFYDLLLAAYSTKTKKKQYQELVEFYVTFIK